MNKKQREIIKQLEKRVKTDFKGDLHHGWPHLNRVRNYALIIGKKEGADLFIIEVAALLHDIAKINHGLLVKNHAEKGAQMTEGILTEFGIEKRTVKKICDCIRAHSRKEPPKPKTVEQKVLHDADGLELVGAVGILRTALYASYYDKTWADMLRKVKGRTGIDNKFYTATGKRIAAKRIKLVKNFYKELKKELKIEKTKKKKN